MHKINLPLVLLPGLACDASSWHKPVLLLKEFISEIKVILLNDDSQPQHLVKTVLENAPPYFILMGHSLGGWIALELMKKAPERVAFLILLSTTARRETKENILFRQCLINNINKKNYVDIVKNLIPKYISKNNLLNNKMKKTIYDSFSRTGYEKFILQQKAIINRPGSLDVLDKIKCPCLIVHATDDEIIDACEQEEMLTHIPNSYMITIKNCGHFSFIEEPQQLIRKIKKWLLKFYTLNSKTRLLPASI